MGTSQLNSCFDLNNDGYVTMPYLVKTPEILVDVIRAKTTEFISIEDTVTITGSLIANGAFKYSSSTISYNAPFENNIGQIDLVGASGNYTGFNQKGIATPTFNTRSVGTKVSLYPQVNTSSTDVDYAIGIAGSTLWFSIPSVECAVRWFINTNVIIVLANLGLIVNNQLYRADTGTSAINTPQTITLAQILTRMI